VNAKIAEAADDDREVSRDTEKHLPRLGVIATHPIQYQAPLYQEISRRGRISLEVAFFDLKGAVPHYDSDFGKTVVWDIDLLNGYRWTKLQCDSFIGEWPIALARWIARHDIVVLHGHSQPKMLSAAAICRAIRVPYLLRGESHAESQATGFRRLARHALATFTVSGAAGALPIGNLNTAFYDRYGHVPHFPAPYSVDNDRFRAAADIARNDRRERIASTGLDPQRPVVIFSGKLIQRKRPLDAVQAIAQCAGELNLLILGDGPLRDEIRKFEARLPIRCLGFVNQSDLPRWYACGDVLVLPSERELWGLVVNEGMACGLIPVVSDAVGCAPDLVQGVGEVFPVGDINSLAQGLLRASKSAGDLADVTRRRLDQFSIVQTASGYEQAALALYRRSPR
jgi:glycosyltransferase involved in cell wall biosynthesis